MSKHFELIHKYCKVIEVVGDSAIYYVDHGTGYAEIGEYEFYCNSLEEFHTLLEMCA